MEQITVGVSLEFTSPLTHEQQEELRQQFKFLIENEVAEGGALWVDENEVVDYSIEYDDE